MRHSAHSTRAASRTRRVRSSCPPPVGGSRCRNQPRRRTPVTTTAAASAMTAATPAAAAPMVTSEESVVVPSARAVGDGDGDGGCTASTKIAVDAFTHAPSGRNVSDVAAAPSHVNPAHVETVTALDALVHDMLRGRGGEVGRECMHVCMEGGREGGREGAPRARSRDAGSPAWRPHARLLDPPMAHIADVAAPSEMHELIVGRYDSPMAKRGSHAVEPLFWKLVTCTYGADGAGSGT